MRVLDEYKDGERVFTLAISNHHQINKMFFDTPWQDGLYRQLARIDGAKSSKARFTNASNGTRRCITIPLKGALNLSDDASEGNLFQHPPF